MYIYLYLFLLLIYLFIQKIAAELMISVRLDYHMFEHYVCNCCIVNKRGL